MDGGHFAVGHNVAAECRPAAGRVATAEDGEERDADGDDGSFAFCVPGVPCQSSWQAKYERVA